MKLTNPTDETLNVAFAIEVAGWRRDVERPNDWWIPIVGLAQGEELRFTKSADLVLPWLEKAFPEHPLHDHSFCIEIDWQPVHARYRPNYQWGYSVQIFPKHTGVVIGTAETLAKAAVIALLRAHNVEVEFA